MTPHPAHASSSLQGHFLIATPVIDRGFFSRSLTYICQHNQAGAMGIVVNQCLDLSVADLLEHLELGRPSAPTQQPVLAGGPVQRDHGFVLHRGNPLWEDSLVVGEDICLTASKDILRAIAMGEGPEPFLIALGYAGWAAGQLEAEMAENSWLTVPADPTTLFERAPEERLAAAGWKLGVNIDLLSAEAGHA